MSVTYNKLPVTFQEALEIIHYKVDARAWLTPKGHSKKEYSCPFCPSSDAVAAIPDSKGKWKCFSCDKVFDVLDVIQQVEGVSWKEAFKMCCDDAGIEVIRDNDPRNDFSALKDEYLSAPFSTGTPAAPPADLPPLKELCTPEHWKKLHAAALSCEYLTKTRGIPAEVIARHPDGIGFSEQARPPMNPKARVKAVIFRPSRYSYMMRFSDAAQVEKFTYGHKKAVCKATDEQGNRRDELAPHIWNPAALDGGRPVFIVEGILDALSLETVGAEAVALQGTSGIDRLMHELDARRAAGKTVPVLVDALDADAPGRKAAKKLKEGAEARGVSIYDGAKIVGSCKDANEALTSDRAAFAERVKAATRDAEKSAAEQSTDREEATAMQEVPAAEQKPADLPSLPKGNGGIINPAAIGTGGLVFIAENEKAAAEITNAGGIAIGAGTQIALNFLFDELDKRKEAGQEIPAAFVDCLTSGDAGRAIVRDFIEPRCKLLGIKLIQAIPVFVSDGTGVQQRDALPELVDAAGKRFETLLEEEKEAERQAYAAESAAAKIPDMLKYTSTTKPFSPTGFSKLDTILDGGFYPGLYFVGAVSSLGKTTFCLQIADAVAAHGEDVLYFSLEMSSFEIMGKSISRLTHIAAERQHVAEIARPVRDVLTGSRQEALQENQKAAIIEAAGEYMESFGRNIHIIEAVGDLTVGDIRADVEKHIRITGRKPLVVIDYLQILAPSSDRLTDKQAVDHTVVALRQLARDKELTIFAISSFNRDNYQNPVSTAALKESGNLEYSADIIFGLQFFGLDRDRDRDTNDSKRRDRLECLRQAREADKRDGRPLYIQLKILKARCGYGEDCFFRYHPRYNHFEPCDEQEAKEWLSRVEGDAERLDADIEFANSFDNMDGGKKKATGRKRGSKEDGSRRL